MKIIAIDSSGLVASVAIVQDEEVIAEYNVQGRYTSTTTPKIRYKILPAIKYATTSSAPAMVPKSPVVPV